MSKQAITLRGVVLEYMPISFLLFLGILLPQAVLRPGSDGMLLVWIAVVSLSLGWLAWRSFRGAARLPGVLVLALSGMMIIRWGLVPLANAVQIALGLVVIWLAIRAISTGSTMQRRWSVGLWALVGLQVMYIGLNWGRTRQPCSWLDPLRLVAGCSRSVVFSDSMRMIALSEDGTTTAGIAYEVEFSPKDLIEDIEKRILVEPSTVDVRRISDGRRLTTLAHPAYVEDLALSTDGSLVATISNDDALRVWRASDGTLLQTISVADVPVDHVSFTPDGLTVAALSGSDQRTLRSWRVSDGATLQPTGLPEDTTEVVFSRDGRYLLAIVLLTNEVSIFPAGASQPLRTIKIGQTLDGGAALSPDGQLLVTGGQDLTPGVGDSVKIWRVGDGTLLHSFPVSQIVKATNMNYVQDVVFSADGTRVAASVSPYDLLYELILVWRVSDGQFVGSLDVPEIYSLGLGLPEIYSPGLGSRVFEFSQDGRRLIVAREGGVDSWPAP